jgi:hypothetical protein
MGLLHPVHLLRLLQHLRLTFPTGRRRHAMRLMGWSLVMPHRVDPDEPVASVDPMRYWNTDTKQPSLRRQHFASW